MVTVQAARRTSLLRRRPRVFGGDGSLPPAAGGAASRRPKRPGSRRAFVPPFLGFATIQLYPPWSWKNRRACSNVEIRDLQGVGLDEIAARLDEIAHQRGEDLFG